MKPLKAVVKLLLFEMFNESLVAYLSFSFCFFFIGRRSRSYGYPIDSETIRQ